MSEPFVTLRDVFCVHRTPEGDAAALQGASLDVARGELVCVLGPSGAGKTTMLSVIAGRQVPAAGTVLVAGRDVGRLPDRARAQMRHTLIGFMAQSAASVLADDLDARQAIALPLALRGAGRTARRRRVDELLAATGLERRARARPRELSGGERQRLALCAALAHRPALLLADEPTAELDAAAAAAVQAAIAHLARAQATTVIMVSHDPATASLAHRTIEIADGRLAQERRDGEAAVVIGHGGWLRLPQAVLAQAGIGDRVEVHAQDGQVVLTRVTSNRVPAQHRSDETSEAGRPFSERVPAAVSVENLSVELGRGPGRRRVLGGLTCALTPGSLSAVSGPSGSGKTTLLRVLAGLSTPSQGAVRIDGLDVGGLGPEARADLRRRRVGYLPQDPVAIGFLSATENLVLALRWRGWSPDAALPRAADLLQRVELRERSRQRVARLSAGEVQRVALARALAGWPALVILDEPTSRLDRARARTVAELLAATAAGKAQTIVCATHDPEILARAQHVIDLGSRGAAQ